MGTTFDAIEERALNRVLDFDIPMMSEDMSNRILDSYLQSAETYISEIYEDIDFSKNVDSREYSNTLENIVIEMLTVGILYFWILPKLLNTQHLKNNLSTSEYNLYSPANLLDKLQNVVEMLDTKFERLLTDYGFNHGSGGSTIADLQV